jgi:large subunit ribosomal protein L14
MIMVQSLVRIADNSGGYMGLCIKIIGKNKKAAVGDAVVIAIKSILINRKITHQRKKKVLKGTVRRAIVIRHSYQVRRHFNIFIKGSSSAVALLGN